MNNGFIIKSIIKTVAIVLLLIQTSSFVAQGQPVEVVKSTEKINLNGDIFYVHTVKKGETLYSIAKAYSLNVNDIIAKNPLTANDIKVDQILKIPESTSISKSTNTTEPVKEGIVTHEIAAGQTLYGIARVYGVKVADIEQANPGAKFDSLKVGQQLVIPVEKKKQVSPAPSDSAKYIIHKVAEKETLYALARKYNVRIDDITNSNAAVAKDGLIVGAEIRIPILVSDSTQPGSNNVSLQPAKQVKCSEPGTITNKEIDIALLLPFFSEGNPEPESESSEDSPNEEKILQKPTEAFNPLGMNFIEFYQGVLMATDELKKQGLKIKLHVYDTEKGVSKIDDIINSADFKKNELVIGPVFPDQIERISTFTEENKMLLVSPISNSGNTLKSNSYFFQINPGLEREMDESINLLLSDSAQNIVIAYNSTLADSVQFLAFKKEIKAKLGNKADSIKEIGVYDNDFTTVLAGLDSLKCNYVLSPSIDEIFVTNLLSKLSTKLIYFRIHVVGMMEWTRFKGIDMNYLHDLQLAYHSAFYTDYDNNEVKEFLKKYRLLFGTEPYKTSKYGFNYSMLGYDIANYFISGYSMYGNNLGESVQCVETIPLVAPFKFIKTSSQLGYINSYMQTVQYFKDYSVQRVELKK